MTTILMACGLPLLTAAGIVVIAVVLNRVVRRLSLSAGLLAGHGVVVLGTVIPSLFGKGGGEFPFDDIYIPYFVYPGLMPAHVNSQVSHILWPWLHTTVGYHEGSYLCIVLIPALLTAVLGGVFWVLIGRALEKMRTANQAVHAISASAPQHDG